MDTALIERLARLRGIGDAYHDYRGELQHFSLETKAGILSAMGCAVDDQQRTRCRDSRRLEAARWRKFLPAVATARGARIGFDINVTAREFGATIVWRVHFEDGSRLDGVDLDAPIARKSGAARSPDHGLRAGASSWPSDLPPGYHELEAKIAGGARRSLSTDRFAAEMLRAGGDRRRPAALGRRGAAVYAALPRQLGHRRFSRSASC